MPFTIHVADPRTAPIRHLIKAHVAHGDAAYPAESNHHLTPEDYAQSDVVLYAAWDGTDCLGMLGLLKLNDSHAEVKSMHVLEAARGRGVAAALLTFIIQHATGEKLDHLFLETGSRDASAAARALYERFGFGYCAPFGDYIVDPESVFMDLRLS
jgi:putative acetyltransferase